MKKSAAPSKKFVNPLVEPSSLVGKTKNIPEKENYTKTLRILNILNKSNVQDKVCATSFEEELGTCKKLSNEENSNHIVPNRKIFNVVWRKKTAKKHKTWQDDGILEIINCSAVLKNLTGAEVARGGNIKTDQLDEGSILSMGDKDVQLLELITNTSDINMKRPSSELNSEPVSKKSKFSSCASPLLHLKSKVRKKQTLVVDSQTLSLPQPPQSHQWNFNVNKKPVTEVYVDTFLAKLLRPHQRSGVVFLYECILGYKQENCFGAILADEMGLGKTLQCITLIWTLFKKGPYGGVPVIKKCLIITPSSLTKNWEKEFINWLGRERIKVFLIDSKNKLKDAKNVPVVIISYEMFVRYFEDLNQLDFDLLICDEGHRLKNNSIQAAILLNQLNCKRRVILSGTPIQNDLQEFYSLCNFVNPGILGENLEFRKNYEEPITASRNSEANEQTKKIGEERAKDLNKKTQYFILRRTQEILDKYLPAKTECVVFCKSSQLQRKLYSATLDFWENSEDVIHFNIITTLKKICNHPFLIKHNTESNCELNSKLYEILSENYIGSPEDSGKLEILFNLIKNVLDSNEKLVIVSAYTQTLNLIGNMCRKNGYSFSRLDGSVPSNQRCKLVDNFNNNSNDLIFLLSSKAGGVGLNLFGASKLVLFDSDWNPATDVQAMARIWRDGQKHSVTLYRFLTTGTIEEKIYQRQISKTDLSSAVVTPCNTNSVRLSDDELKDLFTPDFDCDSLTHSLLKCGCLGDGSVQEINENIEQRNCQLGLDKQEKTQNFHLNHLKQWEHFKQPINTQIFKELGLINSESIISYIFRNKSIL